MLENQDKISGKLKTLYNKFCKVLKVGDNELSKAVHDLLKLKYRLKDERLVNVVINGDKIVKMHDTIFKLVLDVCNALNIMFGKKYSESKISDFDLCYKLLNEVNVQFHLVDINGVLRLFISKDGVK